MGEHDGHRERLRKQFLDHGMESMRDYEVLELLLFYAIPRRDTNALARQLLKHFGSIAAILEASPAELKNVAGIGENAAVLLRLITPLSRRYLQSRTDKGIILNSTRACGKFLIPYFLGEVDELAYLLCLDAKHKLLTCRLLHRGSVNAVAVSLRKAAEIAMACNATSVVLAHNHPGGLALPSDEDYATTNQLREAMKLLGIRLEDHIIVADDDYVSMADNGYFLDP